jgi:hypothetical protein
MVDISPISLNFTPAQLFVMVLLYAFIVPIALLIWKKSDKLETFFNKASDKLTCIFRKKE